MLRELPQRALVFGWKTIEFVNWNSHWHLVSDSIYGAMDFDTFLSQFRQMTLSHLKIILGPTIRAATLGTDDDFRNYVKTGQSPCQVVGNGVSGITGSVKNVQGRTYKDILQKLDVKFNFHPFKSYVKPDNFEMKTSSQTGVCNGDSGGPLYCKV